MEEILLMLFLALVTEEKEKDTEEEEESGEEDRGLPDKKETKWLNPEEHKKIVSDRESSLQLPDSFYHSDPSDSEESPEQSQKKKGEEGLPPGEHIGPHNGGERGQDDVTENQHVVSSEEEVIEKMKRHDFTINELINKIAYFHVHSSTRKKANEVYSWGSGHQVEESGWKKHEIVGVGVGGAVASGLIAIGVPFLPVG